MALSDLYLSLTLPDHRDVKVPKYGIDAMKSNHQKWPSRISTIFLTIFLIFMVPTLGIWLGVLKGGQLDSLVTGTLNQPLVRQDISQELAKTIISNMDKKSKKQAEQKKVELADAISLQLAQAPTQKKISSIANQFFTAITKGQSSVTLDPSAIAEDLVTAVNSVSGIEKIQQKSLKDLKPVTVGSSSKPLPDLSPIVRLVTTIAFVTLALSILCTVLLARFSRTVWRSLSVPLLVAGILWSGIYFTAFQIFPTKLESGIQADVIPVVARAILSGIHFLGVTFLVIGAALLATHLLVRSRTKSLEVTTSE